MNKLLFTKRPKLKVQNSMSKSSIVSSIRLFSILFFLFSLVSFAQEKPQDTTKVTQLDDVMVSAVRVTEKTPVSFSNLTKEEIAPRNLGQDIPVLMNYMTSVVTTTDAGNGVGYTGIRVRGSDATRVNVTINGIPYNDSESQGTFWVNMPDFASSLESLQLQRGVGTSTNGAAAFGASLNMLTDSYSNNASGEISSSYGSFNSNKNTVKFNTGLMNDHFEIAGRLSTIKSDGYVDRASSDLKSYFLQGTYVSKTTLIKALAFGGTEKTYQAWYGVDEATLESNRTFNYAGMYADENGNTRFYDNQTDNYQQDHYQLHWNEILSDNWNTNLAFHFSKGKGYYEEYKEDQDFADYGLNPIADAPTVTTTDLVRQKWLDNDFYGTTFSANYSKDKLDVILGGALNKYEGDHFGKIVWARFASQTEPEDNYYFNSSTKTDGNIYAKADYQLFDDLSLYGDLQYRIVNYKSNNPDSGLVDDTFNFFNPKAGLNFDINTKNKLYFSYARANREPSRGDYENGSPKPENLNDYELGWRFNATKVKVNSNFYLMDYQDQLVLTGELDDVGNPIHTNSGQSYRIGFEVDAMIQLSKKWTITPNATFSTNKNVDFVVEENGVLTNLGDSNIAYSPNIIVGDILTFSPLAPLKLSLLSKYVGEQYMNNVDDNQGKLEDYFVNDFNASYEIKTKSVLKSISINLLVNNIFDVDYVSNGVDYGGGYVYYYPQAGINFLAGLTLKF
ncbi:MAG TPA: TonB-dependent receptor [Flavobacterium sp.]|nr:TonB-dependent receptor [Flavobacterium sp.]